jgi:hypothetical protein
VSGRVISLVEPVFVTDNPTKIDDNRGRSAGEKCFTVAQPEDTETCLSCNGKSKVNGCEVKLKMGLASNPPGGGGN